MQKYEREIEDLLQQLESEDPERPRPIRRDRPPQLPRQRPPVASPLRSSLRMPHLGAGHWMILGVVLLVVSRFLDGTALQPAQSVLAIVGVLLFLWPIGSNLLGRGPERDDKLWRGRPVQPEDASWSDFRDRVEDSARNFKRRFTRRRP